LRSGEICVPPRTDPREVTDFVHTYIGDNRAIAETETAIELVRLALKARWPCVGVGRLRLAPSHDPPGVIFWANRAFQFRR
jgi:hypothetical protein